MINKFILQGRLTAKPELKQTQSGVAVCSFTVAWSEKIKDVETKCFQRCVAWRGTAEFLNKYFAKGQELVVEGKMSTREWEADGQKRSVNELVVDAAHFCGSKAKDSSSGTPVAETQPQPIVAPQFEVLADDDALPF